MFNRYFTQCWALGSVAYNYCVLMHTHLSHFVLFCFKYLRECCTIWIIGTIALSQVFLMDLEDYIFFQGIPSFLLQSPLHICKQSTGLTLQLRQGSERPKRLAGILVCSFLCSPDQVSKKTCLSIIKAFPLMSIT